MSRGKIYRDVTTWTSPFLYVLLILDLITGLASIKGREFAQITFGLINPAYTGKLHTVWLVLVTGLLVYIHGTSGLLTLVTRARFTKNKLAWEIAVVAISVVLLAQFLVLYFL